MHVTLSDSQAETRTALRIQTTVQPGHRVNITNPQLPEGQSVEVIVVLPDLSRPDANSPAGRFDSALEFLDSLPKGPSPRSFKTWEEYERFLDDEKNAWDR